MIWTGFIGSRQNAAALPLQIGLRPGAGPADNGTSRLEHIEMQLEIRLKKRWITSVLKEADAMSTPLPWQRRRRDQLSSNKRLSGPFKADAKRA